jgi:hypothetical protein
MYDAALTQPAKLAVPGAVPRREAWQLLFAWNQVCLVADEYFMSV